MREFNKREQLIMRKLAEIDISSMSTSSRFLQDNFFTKSNAKALIVNHNSKDVLYYIDPNQFNNIQTLRKSNHELFELLILLSYLNENRYVSIITTKMPAAPLEALHSDFDSSISLNGNILTLNSKGDYLDINQPDLIKNSSNQILLKGGLLNGYYDLIYNTVFGLIIPSEELLDLVKHNFKSKDDRKHFQNIFVAWTGITIALILGILGIWNPFNSEKTQNGELLEQISIDLDTIKTNNQENSIYLNNINKEMTKPDTLKKR
jgi:hypothetical protein